MRPIDIARKLRVSTTMLRNYEELGMVPLAERSASGYRQFTEMHLAYFTCIREMQKGFSLAFISKVMKRLLAGEIDKARWLITEAQAKLYGEMKIIDAVRALLLDHEAISLLGKEFLTIYDVSHRTNIPVSTIRYWDARGLLSVQRSTHNYREFSEEDIRHLLILYTLKLSKYFKGNRHSIHWMKDMAQECHGDQKMILKLTAEVSRHLRGINELQQEGILAFLTLAKQLEAGEVNKR